MPDKIRIAVTVNGTAHDVLVEPRTLLLDFLRDELALTGAHAGCEQGACGACTVLVDGEPTRCVPDVRRAARRRRGHARWSRWPARTAPCTPCSARSPRTTASSAASARRACCMAACALLEHNPHPEPSDVREALSGNLCRCTGYQNIVRSVVAAGAEV